jgi:hypothetical protein
MRDDHDPIDVNLRAAWPGASARPALVDAILAARHDDVAAHREALAYAQGQRSARRIGVALLFVIILVPWLAFVALLFGVEAQLAANRDMRTAYAPPLASFRELGAQRGDAQLTMKEGIVVVRGGVLRPVVNEGTWRHTPPTPRVSLESGEAFFAIFDGRELEVESGGARVTLARGCAATFRAVSGGMHIVVHAGSARFHRTDRAAPEILATGTDVTLAARAP